MESNNETTPECLARNYYYQKRINMDPERCKLNLERAIKRKQRESQVNVACDHYQNDKCQIRNISHEELEEFHERYWNCPGTVNKRIFMATHLAVDPTDNDCKKDINITCYCPRNDGTLDIICQKSFISVLGVSKHKVLGIGHAKLINGEYLYKEKRGGNRWKPYSLYDDKNKSLNDYSNENSQNHSNTINENDSTMGSNISESGGINMNINRTYLNTNEDNGESNKSSESNRRIPSLQRTKHDNIIDENNEDDNAIFEPQVKNPKKESTYEDDDDEDESVNIFQPVVQITEKSEENISRLQAHLRRPNQDSSMSRDNKELEALPGQMIRKHSVFETVEERMAARQKARAILENLHSQATRIKKPAQFNHPHHFPNQMNRNNYPNHSNHPNMHPNLHPNHPNHSNHPNHPGHSNWQSRNYPPNLAGHRNFPSPSYMGPENWQRTLERNIRRRQRMQEVKIDCNHNLTRFCKVISVPHEDLVNFHNMFWNCQGIVEERIFLARYMVVTPCNHRREMAIATRIPTSDGQLVEVCQKSFLSVVGITKHKVQAAARAKLKGTLFRKDMRGGFQKPRSQIEKSPGASPTMQISKVEGRYQGKDRTPRAFNQNDTIEIEDSSDDERENNGDNENYANKNMNFEDSQTGNGEEDEEDYSQIIAAEDAFANGKLNYDEFRKNIERNRINEVYEVKLTRIKRELNLYKRRTRKLMIDRKNYLLKLIKLRKENRKLRKQTTNSLSQNINEQKLEDNTVENEGFNDLKIKDGDQNRTEKADSIEINSFKEQSKDLEISETDSIRNNNITSNYQSEEIFLNKILENEQNYETASSLVDEILKENENIQSENS